ncbi:MAG: thiamine pyrophosphate-binding protein [Endomicrobiaceae bacterium]
MIKLSDFIAKHLKEVYNVNHIFMISGGGAMHLNDSFGKYIPYICNHHEQASAIAAEGYARLNQDLAVVNVTTGPGGLNCLNGVFGQWTDTVPVLYISGQVKFATTIASCPDLKLRQLGDQEVDIISVVKPLTKYAVMIKNPSEIKYHLDKAVYEATHGRKGPVWIDIPMNIQSSMIDEKKLKEFKNKESIKKNNALQPYIEKIIGKINASQRPLIIAGNGIKLSKQEKCFKDILQNLKIPVVTTFNGIDILDYKDKNYTGRIGTIGQRCGNFALQNADLVISLGTRNNIRQVSYNWENFAKNAFKIIIDIDKNELKKPLVKPDMAIKADLADFLPAFEKSIKTVITEKFERWMQFCKKLQLKYSFENTKEYKQKSIYKINPYIFINTLTKLLDKKDIIVAGNGSACVCLFQAGIVKQGQRIIMNSGDASMGYDLPASIGASVASNNKRRTVCLAGDGSVMMNLQELQTIKNYNLPVKIFVLNNNGYISIRQTQNNFFNGRLTACSVCSGVTLPDFTKIGKSFNLKSVKIKKAKLLEKQIKEVLDYNGPVLCEVILEADYIFLPKLSSKKLEDGTMISPSLEDMYPFLDRKEFEENIIK